jgi:hypothetical protein
MISFMSDAPESVQAPIDDKAALVAFLGHRDVACPRCDYNLRNATSAACPECGEAVRLTVGLERPIMGALLATIAPMLGCGVCAIIFIVLIMVAPGAPRGFVFMTFVMFLSGLGAAAVIVCRRAFMRQSRAAQRAWAIASIIVHAALVAMVVSVLIYGR